MGQTTLSLTYDFQIKGLCFQLDAATPLWPRGNQLETLHPNMNAAETPNHRKKTCSYINGDCRSCPTGGRGRLAAASTNIWKQ